MDENLLEVETQLRQIIGDEIKSYIRLIGNEILPDCKTKEEFWKRLSNLTL